MLSGTTNYLNSYSHVNMDQYITRAETGLQCSHPSIARIWETGAFGMADRDLPPREREVWYQIHILTFNGERKTIEGPDPSKVTKDAEGYLQSLKNDN